jgi:solute carrier family 13 (sodium-dependent dicarboxylate transporter), member 2/3/5
MQARHVALFLGPVFFALCAATIGWGGMVPTAQLALGVTLWMATWWITEVVPPAATALLPVVLFPICGILPLKTTTAEYGNELIFLFMCGFFLGKAIEKWQLHRRIALRLVLWLGDDPARIVLGFMLATAAISMWLSNTATVVMMTPVALAVAVGQPLRDTTGQARQHFSKALLLGVGYAASIGGMATLVGTPTNAIFSGFFKQQWQRDVTFFDWFRVGFPYAILLLGACWWILMRLFPQEKKAPDGPSGQSVLRAELQALGPMTLAEKRVLFVFLAVVLAWLTGSWAWYCYLPGCSDTVVIAAGAVLLFVLPSGRADGTPLLDWATANQIPWNVLVFFGGGLALAKGFDQSGLATWLGQQLTLLGHWPAALVVLLVLVFVVLLSEIASNIATATMMMPVLASIATAMQLDPFGLLMVATVAASAGFALPVANAANSVVYATGMLDTRDMIRAGTWLDCAAIGLLWIFWSIS